MEAVNTKMLRILVGMARLQIQSPDGTQHDKYQQEPIHDDWVSVGKTVEVEREVKGSNHDTELEEVTKGCNLYEVVQSVTNDLKLHEDVENESNAAETTHKTSTAGITTLPILTGISTVMIDDDAEGETGSHIQSQSSRKYENKPEYTKGKNLDKGKTQLLSDSDTSVAESLSEKYLSSNYRRFSGRQVIFG
jgi:hypothetical protein